MFILTPNIGSCYIKVKSIHFGSSETFDKKFNFRLQT